MEKLTDIELTGITLSEEKPRSFMRANNILIQVHGDFVSYISTVHVQIVSHGHFPVV